MQNLRGLFLMDPEVVYLNHGSFGATPKPVFEVYQNWQREMERQPVEFFGHRITDLLAESRTVLADYLGVQRDHLVYVTSATVGVNIIARSLDLAPGDEVLATNHEYGACDRTWRFLSQKNDFVYVNQSVSIPLASEDDFIEQLWQGVTPRTKVIFLSHITSPTSIIFPVTKVCKRARAEGILTLVDGAHAPGQISVNLEDIGADFYTGNLHKWLCAPKGAGFLYTRPEVQCLLEPLVVSWGWQSEMPGPSRFVDVHEWQGTRDLSAFLAVPAAIRFQQENDWGRVREDCHALAIEAEMRVREMTGLPSLYSSDTWFAQMVSATLPAGTEMLALKEFLYNRWQIEIPLIQWHGSILIRISVQGYNGPEDIHTLREALAAYR